ncbi:hypothetical protein LX36DRAFT_590539 [Colletotrichum falcatum]|nr:hypothetical protein LX36DRAFT_590539 [Colletotrichum falcatum]
MYRHFLGCSLAILTLTTCVAGRVVDVHSDPVSVRPSLNDSDRGKSNISKDADTRPRSNESQILHGSSFSRAVRPRELAPFELRAVECHDPKYPEYKNHPDVHSQNVDIACSRFCRSALALATLTAVDDVKTHPLHAWRWRFRDHVYVHMDFKVHWRVNCRTEPGFQEIEYPLGPYGPTCRDIMFENYRSCNNGGIGGSTQAGCLVYTLNAGRRDKYY